MEIDKKIIVKLVQALEELKKSLKGIDIESKDSPEEEKIEYSGTAIKSPIVGTAYLAPEPGGKKFVEVGMKIKKGDTVMIVEAMKTMNHVPSSAEGVVKKVCVEDGQPVEFGQIITILE
tara:strand:- start:1623 stop:1979 length:357 start_codon:yes stop_codon:yes gene_type:complete